MANAADSILTPELRARVKRLELRTQTQMASAMSGAYRSSFRGSGIEFEEVRPYQPGDEVRSIDWNVTARTGAPHIKTYREERQLRVHLAVDVSASMDFGTRIDTKREKAAELCAVVAFAAAQNRDLTSLDLFSDGPTLHLEPKVGQDHTLRILRAIVGAPHASGSGRGFVEALQGTGRVLRRRALLFVISDFCGFGDADWATELRLLGRRHDVIAVRVTDPFEERLPRAGWFRMRDAESGRVEDVDTDSAAVRRAWEQRAAERRAQFLAHATEARAQVIELSTDRSSTEPLIALFRRRAKALGRTA